MPKSLRQAAHSERCAQSNSAFECWRLTPHAATTLYIGYSELNGLKKVNAAKPPAMAAGSASLKAADRGAPR
jgi:hypothetical protein